MNSHINNRAKWICSLFAFISFKVYNEGRIFLVRQSVNFEKNSAAGLNLKGMKKKTGIRNRKICR